jgi:hypothetical protein
MLVTVGKQLASRGLHSWQVLRLRRSETTSGASTRCVTCEEEASSTKHEVQDSKTRAALLDPTRQASCLCRLQQVLERCARAHVRTWSSTWRGGGMTAAEEPRRRTRTQLSTDTCKETLLMFELDDVHGAGLRHSGLRCAPALVTAKTRN